MSDSEILAMRAEIAQLHEMIADLVSALPVSETMTVSDIAKKRGCSYDWLAAGGYPWRLPNFGKAEEGGGTRRWRRETVRAWYASPTWEAEHRAEWEAMPFPARREILGVA